MPDISIIIPAYNEEEFIHDCLSSVFEQRTNKEVEVIVVDNNSKDATGKTASKFGVKLILEKKPGATAARNTGARFARSNILYFLDADCRLLPGFLDKLFLAFKNQPAFNIVAGPYVYDRDGFLPLFGTNSLSYFYLHHWLFKAITGISYFPAGNFAIKKNVFWQVGGFDEKINNQEIVLADDLDLAIRLNKAGLNKVLYEKKYKVYSALRGVKKFPVKYRLVRLLSAIRILQSRH